jgi:hypothetical protein
MNKPNKKGKNVVFPENFTDVKIQDDEEDEIYRDYREKNATLEEDEDRSRWEKGFYDNLEIQKGNPEAIQKRISQIKYYETPIEEKISEAISKGKTEDAKIRHEKKEKIAKDHQYDYWWLGGKKTKKNKNKKQKTKKRKKTKKSTKNKKIKK